MIATQHTLLADDAQVRTMDIASSIHLGRVSRIQDGFLVHTHAQPRNKYDGVHFVVANCTLQRCKGSSTFELVGDVGKTFLCRWNEVMHQQVCKDHDIPFFHNELAKFRVNTNKTKWFQFSNGAYRPSSSADVDDNAQGFAVIMTRGAWFHASKRNVHTSWHLVEWISI